MKKMLSRLFNVLKYLLFLVSLTLLLYYASINFTVLNRSKLEILQILIPLIFVLIVFFISIVTKSKVIKDNLLFNFISVIVFITIIIVCLRSKFDTNMLLYHKYNIDFNPIYFFDNMAIICIMLYMIGGSNLLLLLTSLFKEKSISNTNLNIENKTQIINAKESLDDEELL